MSKIQTAGELRGFLIEVMQDVRSGRMDTSQAHAVAKMAAQINNSISTEVSAAIQLEKLGKGSAEAGSMLVGVMANDALPTPETSKLREADKAHFNLPGSKAFCDQCEMLISKDEADGCKSKFCSLKPTKTKDGV